MATTWLGLAVCATLASACGDGETPRFRTLTDAAPEALENALLYVAQEPDDTHVALILDVAGRESRITTHDLPEGEVEVYPRPDHDGEALVLTGGRAAELVDGKGRDAINSHVMVFDRRGERARYELSGRYGALTASDDGRFVIAYAPSGNWSTEDSIAVLDLSEADPAEKVPSSTVRALDGVGPSRVAFAPAGDGRRLAVLVMTDAVNIVDLEQPASGDKVLPLKLPDGSGMLRAKKVLFHDDRIFIQPDQGNDVLVVRLDDDAESPGGFLASLSSLTTETQLADIALVEDDVGVRLVALGQGRVRLIDTTTGDGESTTLGNGFSALHVFSGRSPFDDQERPRAMLYGTDSIQVGFVDLMRGLRGNERTLDVVTLSSPLQAVAFARQLATAVVTGRSGGVSIVDLEERTVSAVSTEAGAKQLVLVERDGTERAWVTTDAGQVGIIDLTRRAPSELLLDHPAGSVVPLFGEGARVAITHTSASGRVTLVDGREPARSSAREIAGFLFSRFLD